MVSPEFCERELSMVSPEFCGILVIIDGRFPLAECYNVSNPFWSWQMVLLGDPLYRPFARSGPQSH